MPVVSTENVSVFIPLILRGKVSGSGEQTNKRGVTEIPARVVLAQAHPNYCVMYVMNVSFTPH